MKRASKTWRAARAHMAGWLVVAVLTLGANEVRAHDFRTEVGLSAHGTDWRDDFAAYGSLKLAVRFADIAGAYVQGHSGYAPVDQRLLTLLSLGGQARPDFDDTRPHARLGFIHQHEESLSVVANDFGSALFGVGDGIRHRAGGEVGIGVDVKMWQRKALHLYVTVDANAKFFPDELGPKVYAGGGVGVGFNYAL